MRQPVTKTINCGSKAEIGQVVSNVETSVLSCDKKGHFRPQTCKRFFSGKFKVYLVSPPPPHPSWNNFSLQGIFLNSIPNFKLLNFDYFVYFIYYLYYYICACKVAFMASVCDIVPTFKP